MSCISESVDQTIDCLGQKCSMLRLLFSIRFNLESVKWKDKVFLLQRIYCEIPSVERQKSRRLIRQEVKGYISSFECVVSNEVESSGRMNRKVLKPSLFLGFNYKESSCPQVSELREKCVRGGGSEE